MPRYTLQVSAEAPDGTVMQGFTAQIAPSGQPAPAIFLPATLTLPGQANYNITLSGKQKGFTLVKWSNGQTTPSINLYLNQNTSIIAVFKASGPQTLHIIGKLLDGKSVIGVSIGIINHSPNGGKTIDTMPENITSTFGASYTISTNSTGAVAFKYWNSTAQTDSSLSVSLTGNMTIIAYFQQLAIPYKHSGAGNHTITVIAHTKDGGLMVGAYFQVRIHGQWNHVADGFAPASVTVPDGTEEVVMYHCSQVPSLCGDKFFVYRHYNNTTPPVFTRWQYFNLDHDITFHSFYEVIPASEAVHVTIEAEDAYSKQPIFVNCTCGSTITIYLPNGTEIAQSLEPYSFWLWAGKTYTITVGDLSGYTFAGWTTGATGYSITIIAQPQPGGYDPYYQFFAALYRKF